MVGREAVRDAPEHGLGAAGHVDLLVNAPDIRLHSVGAEVGERGDVSVALALGDEGEDLGLEVGESFVPPGPVKAPRESGWGPCWSS